MKKRQISIQLEDAFLKHVEDEAKCHNRSISSMLGEACYRFFNWRPPQDADERGQK